MTGFLGISEKSSASAFYRKWRKFLESAEHYYIILTGLYGLPFGTKQVPNFFIVYFHVRDLNIERDSLVLKLNDER